MKKAFRLLFVLLLAGCGGFQPNLVQDSLRPDSSFEELLSSPWEKLDVPSPSPDPKNLPIQGRFASTSDALLSETAVLKSEDKAAPLTQVTPQGGQAYPAAPVTEGACFPDIEPTSLETAGPDFYQVITLQTAEAGRPGVHKTSEEIPLSRSMISAEREDSQQAILAEPESVAQAAMSLSASPAAVPQPLPPSRSPSKILAGIPPLVNEKVKSFIDFFQTRADTFFTTALARSQAYETMMKKILREKNLPEELFYLALIESGFNPQAQSRAKACGIWQFMAQTARRYGLKVDKWVDERRDPEKSTYAAAEYLKSLHEMFNCWFLAAAGYNAGEGKILRAMAKAKSQDFWEISNLRYLKRETKEYVPMMLAAMTIAEDPPKYGFSNIAYTAPLSYETVSVPPATRLDRIARASETDLSEIRFLNPSLIRDKTPPGKPFEIRVPAGKKEIFEKNFARSNSRDAGKKHQVRRGDTLAGIAKKYQVPLEELCAANHISTKTILRPGSALLVPR